MDNKIPGIYITTNPFHTVFYVGMSSDLPARIWTHKNRINKRSFTNRYNCTKLVYFETTPNKFVAYEREQEIKNWSRFKKVQLILSLNPEWEDLSRELGL